MDLLAPLLDVSTSTLVRLRLRQAKHVCAHLLRCSCGALPPPSHLPWRVQPGSNPCKDRSEPETHLQSKGATRPFERESTDRGARGASQILPPIPERLDGRRGAAGDFRSTFEGLPRCHVAEKKSGQVSGPSERTSTDTSASLVSEQSRSAPRRPKKARCSFRRTSTRLADASIRKRVVPSVRKDGTAGLRQDGFVPTDAKADRSCTSSWIAVRCVHVSNILSRKSKQLFPTGPRNGSSTRGSVPIRPSTASSGHDRPRTRTACPTIPASKAAYSFVQEGERRCGISSVVRLPFASLQHDASVSCGSDVVSCRNRTRPTRSTREGARVDGQEKG